MAEDVNARIGISADTTQAVSAIRALQAQLEAFYASNKGASRAVSKDIQSMQTNLMQSVNKTGAFRASMMDVTSATQAFTTALEKNKLTMGQTFRYAAGSIAPFGKKFRAEWELIGKVARERVKDLQTQYIKMGRDADGAMKALKIKPLLLDLDSFNTKAMMSAQRMQIFTKLIDHGSTQLLNFGKNTQWAGRQLMVGFTVPLTMLGVAAAKSFMDIEKEVIKLRRVYGDFSTTIQDTDKMVESIKGLATEFTKWGVAVKDTIGLASEAAAAGATGAELVNQVTEATRLAVLGNIDQQKAYETTISVTNAFGIATEDLTKKIDFLNAVENQTVTSIDDLTTAIPKAAPVIQQLGGNVEDLAFFLTAMKEGGINASEGANALKSGLAALINPTGKAAEMLKGFGINIQGIVESNKGDVKGLVIDFAKALDTLDPLNRARAIEQLFGKFQFSRLSTLFKNVIEDGTQAQRVLELTNASTKQLAILSERELAKVQDSTVYKFQAASEKFQAAIAPVGEQFLKMVTPLLEFGTKLLEEFNKMGDGTKNFVIGTVAVLGVIGPAAVMAFGLVANGVAQLIKMFNFFAKGLAGVGKDTQVLGMQTDYMSQQMIEATAAASALSQKHTSLVQVYSSETRALTALAAALERSTIAQQRYTAAAGTSGTKGTRKKYAGGVLSVPGPKGAGDVVPAMLSPGEAVIPADAAKKYQPLIQGMIAGNIPGFNGGAASVGRKQRGSKFNYNYSDVTESTHFAFPSKENYTPEEWLAAYTESFNEFGDQFGWESPAKMQEIMSVNMNGQQTVGGLTGATLPYSKAINQRYSNAKPGTKIAIGGAGGLLESGSQMDDFAGTTLAGRLRMAGASDETITQILRDIPERIDAGFKKHLEGGILELDEKEFGRVIEDAFTEATEKVANKEERAKANRAIRSMLAMQGFSVKNPQGGSRSGSNRFFGTAVGLKAAKEAAQPAASGESVKSMEDTLNKPFPAPKETNFDITKEMVPEGMTEKEYKIRVKDEYNKLDKARRTAFALEMQATKDVEERAKKLRDLVDGNVTKAPKAPSAPRRSDLPSGYSYKNGKYYDAAGNKVNMRDIPGGKAPAGSAEDVMETRKKGGAGKVVAGLGLAAGGMALMGGGDMGEAIGQMLPYIMIEVVMSGMMMFSKQIGGWLKTMGGSVGGKAMGLLSKAGFWGMIASLVVFVVQGVFNMVRDGIREQLEKGMATGSFAAGGKDQLISLAESAGTVGATELARAEQAARVAGVDGKQVDSFGLDYLGTDAGKKLQEDIASAAKSGFSSAQIGSIIGTQLAEAIAQNVITKDQADSIAIRLGEAINNSGIASQIIGQITKLTSSKDVGRITAGISAATMTNFNALSKPTVSTATVPGASGENDFWTNLGNSLMSAGGGGQAVSSPAIGQSVYGGIQDANASTEMFGAQLGFAVNAYAQNQRLLDVIDAQYKSQIEELAVRKDKAKTTEEQARLEEKINDLNSDRVAALDKQREINNDSFEAIQRAIESSGKKIDDISLEALGAKLEKLYEDMPEMAVFAKDAMNRAFGELDNIRLGFQIAGGDLDPITAQKLTQLMVGNPAIETKYDMIISQSGDAAAIELAQSLVGSGLGDQTISAVFEMTNADNIDSVTGVVQDLQAATALSGVDFSGVDASGIRDAANEAERLRAELESSGDTTVNVIAKTEGFEDVQLFINQLGLGGQLDNLSAEQQLNYTLRVNTLLSLEGDPGMNRAFRDWQANGGVGNFNDYVYSLMGAPSAMAGPPAPVQGEFVQGGGGGGAGDPELEKVQEALEKRQKALDIISLKEDKINKKYDERKEALKKIADLNKEVADQQKSQLSIAEALANGDIAGAARAMQAYQEQAAQNAVAQQDRALEQSRQNELDNVSFRGMDRNGLEAEIADLEMKLAEMEYDRVGKNTGGGGGGGGYWTKPPKPPAVDGYEWIWDEKSHTWYPEAVTVVSNQAVSAPYTQGQISATQATVDRLELIPGMEQEVAVYKSRLQEMTDAMDEWSRNNLAIVDSFTTEAGLTDSEFQKLSQTITDATNPMKTLKEELEKLGYTVGPDNTVQIGNMKVSLEQLLDGITTKLEPIRTLSDSFGDGPMSADRIDDLRDRSRAAMDTVVDVADKTQEFVDAAKDIPAQIAPVTTAYKNSGTAANTASGQITTNSDSWFRAAGAYSTATGNMVGFNGQIANATSQTTGIPAVGSAIGNVRDKTSLLSLAMGGAKTTTDNLSTAATNAKGYLNSAKNALANVGVVAGLISNSEKGRIPANAEAMGGMIKPIYRALGGGVPGMRPIGSDTVPALLTPGEFVINRPAVKQYGVNNLKAINNGSAGASSSSVYTYNVTVNAGANASADDIARTVMNKLRQVENQRVKGNRY